MKRLILVIFICGFVLNGQEIGSFHELMTDSSVVTNWAKEIDHQRSDIKLPRNGLVTEYRNFYFYKVGFDGYYIDKKDGSVFRKRGMPIMEYNKGKSDWYSDIQYSNWQLSKNDTNKIFIVEYFLHDTISGIKGRLITKQYGEIELTKEWYSKFDSKVFDDDFYCNLAVLNENLVIAQYDYRVPIRGWYLKSRKMQLYQGSSDSIIDAQLPNLHSYSINKKGDYLIAKVYTERYDDDTREHEIYRIRYDSVEHVQSIPSYSSNFFNKIINDSLVVMSNGDSIHVYNYRKSESVYKHEFKGRDDVMSVYVDTTYHTFSIISSDYILTSHYKTGKLLFDGYKKNFYLGQPIGQLDDGSYLSIGDNNYLYKHNFDILTFDSVDASFDYWVQDDNTIKFIDSSYGAIKEWYWDFGDGNTSNERYPVHTYTESGEYKVTQIVINEYNLKDTVRQVVIARKFLRPSFDFSIFSGQTPFTVQFKNYSSDNAIRYIWNFGDGTYSYEMEPAHTYTIPGEYSISLTAVDEYENFNTFVQPKTIVVTE